MDRDVVLVTIDCWRYDAIDRMSNLQSHTDGFVSSEAICAAPATRGAFPAILHGLYYPRAYTDYYTLRSGGIVEILADNGYATGAVVGSNPYVSPWSEYFDWFWNDRMERSRSDSGLREALRGAGSRLRHAYNYIRLQSRVPAEDVARRARSWYVDQSRPRFLWMHLMDAHIPFLPGLRRGVSTGLLDTYRSHLQYMLDPDKTSDAALETLETLYWQSVQRLDERMGRVLEFVDDDAFVIVLGDHGEEFDHGKYGHARLYDECVRVPLLLSEPFAGTRDAIPRPMRQLDVGPTVLDALGYEVPDDWDGEAVDSAEPRSTFILNHSPMLGRAYAGLRTDGYKLIKTFEEDAETCLGTEAYDLVADEDERIDVYGRDPAVSDLEDRLDRFLDRDNIRSGMLERPSSRRSTAVEDRLRALGYK